jgi:hypothetical protein
MSAEMIASLIIYLCWTIRRFAVEKKALEDQEREKLQLVAIAFPF